MTENPLAQDLKIASDKVLALEIENLHLRNALRAAIPCLIKLGDFVGNEFNYYDGREIDRCAIIEQMRKAINESTPDNKV